MNFLLVFHDAFIFALCFFISAYIASLIILPKVLYNDRFLYCLNLSLIIFILSIAMMMYSGKYSSNPVHNSRSRTPWTWWKINEEEN